jgi:hypothetical protein
MLRMVLTNLSRFKGTDSTFAGFPERLQHLLTETVESAKVECVVYPAYEVVAVKHFHMCVADENQLHRRRATS